MQTFNYRLNDVNCFYRLSDIRAFKNYYFLRYSRASSSSFNRRYYSSPYRNYFSARNNWNILCTYFTFAVKTVYIHHRRRYSFAFIVAMLWNTCNKNSFRIINDEGRKGLSVLRLHEWRKNYTFKIFSKTRRGEDRGTCIINRTST